MVAAQAATASPVPLRFSLAARSTATQTVCRAPLAAGLGWQPSACKRATLNPSAHQQSSLRSRHQPARQPWRQLRHQPWHQPQQPHLRPLPPLTNNSQQAGVSNDEPTTVSSLSLETSGEPPAPNTAPRNAPNTTVMVVALIFLSHGAGAGSKDLQKVDHTIRT